jgi:hypothetical protein
MSTAQTAQAPPFVPSGPPKQDPNIRGLVQRNALSSRLHGPLQALGNRLEVKGGERALAVGTLRSGAGTQEDPFALTAELPNRIRLTIGAGPGTRVLVFDGQTVRSSGGLTPSDYDLLETLVYDTAEHLLLGQHDGSIALRFLGGRFHDGDDPSATAYHIFEARETIAIGSPSRQETKHFYFNSDNWLLERITYSRPVNDVETSAEILFSDWVRVDGQTVARIVERFKNKSLVFRLTINAVSFSPPLSDGIFQ